MCTGSAKSLMCDTKSFICKFLSSPSCNSKIQLNAIVTLCCVRWSWIDIGVVIWKSWKATCCNKGQPFIRAQLRGRNSSHRESPKRRFSQKTADFRRFAPSVGNSSIWRAQETAENRRFSQKTGNRRLGSVTLGPSPLARPHLRICKRSFKNLTFPENHRRLLRVLDWFLVIFDHHSAWYVSSLSCLTKQGSVRPKYKGFLLWQNPSNPGIQGKALKVTKETSDCRRSSQYLRDGPNTVSGSTVSNTELSEFLGARWVPGSELSEFLSAFYFCAKANSPSFSQNSPSLPQNSVRLSEFSLFSEAVLSKQ